MKPVFSLCLAFIGLFSAGVHASAIIRANPLGLFYGYFEASVEFPLTENFAAGPYFGYQSTSSGDLEIDAFMLGARATYAPSGLFKNGLYFGPFATYIPANISDSDNSIDLAFYTLGSSVGYQWFSENGFSFRAGAGPIFYTGSETIQLGENIYAFDYSGSQLYIELVLGFSF